MNFRFIYKQSTSNFVMANNYFRQCFIYRRMMFSQKSCAIESNEEKSGRFLNFDLTASKDEKRKFMSHLPDIVRSLTEVGFHRQLQEANKWYAKSLQYNLTDGKMNRGLAVSHIYNLLVEEHLRPTGIIDKCHIVGWCVELLQASLIMQDDIQDRSVLRRGKPAWHALDNVGMMAVSDAFLLNMSIYKLLKLYLHKEPYYNSIVDLFHKTTLKTCLGQTLDLLTTRQHSSTSAADTACSNHGPSDAVPSDGVNALDKSANNSSEQPNFDISAYTMDRYKAIVKYKTSHYSFHLPFALAMYMAGIDNVECHRQSRAIMLEMGHLFQVQDDYIDCFEDSTVSGKSRTDISEGKCTWLIVVALQRANATQKKTLIENYGRDDAECVRRVRETYYALGLPAVYSKYADSTYNMICGLIEQTSAPLRSSSEEQRVVAVPHNTFYAILNRLHKKQ